MKWEDFPKAGPFYRLNGYDKPRSLWARLMTSLGRHDP